jgi:FMN phosphatase YigB (HAD superfamily)
MITHLLFDFSRVILFPNDSSTGRLNAHHQQHFQSPTYRFTDHFRLNTQLLNYLKTIQDQHYLAIFTTGTIQEHPQLKPHLEPIFQRIFSVPELGLPKTDSQVYQLICQRLGSQPHQTLFIDDTHGNVEAAQAAGLKTIHYQSNPQFFTDLKQQNEAN